MIKFEKEILTDALIDEAMQMLIDHHKEVMPHPDVEINIDKQKYIAMQSLGLVRCYIARKYERMVGYCNFFIAPHPHYKHTTQAILDVLYVDPRFRGIIGAKFLKWCDSQIQSEGVNEIHFTVQEKLDYSNVLTRLGYKQCARIFNRRLK